MYATEFETTVLEDGKIEIPIEYRNPASRIKVIILQNSVQKRSVESGDGFGALAHLANPEHWNKERGAWKKVAVKKYVSHCRQYHSALSVH
ncbi:hypothetical protein AGMMS50212_04600 [Spirochaetia bacterium]|nr:hypothetical protein AGMMS50212_04600 [Spirochaetia bacterium]